MGTKYSSVAISGYNSSPPSDDGTQVGSNQVLWSTIKAKLPDPIKTAFESANTALVTAMDYSVSQKTANYTLAGSDHMKTVEVAPTVTTAITFTLTDAATLTAGWTVNVKNSGTASLTIGRATGGDTINGTAANVTVRAGQDCWFKVNASANGFLQLSSSPHYEENTYTPTWAGASVNPAIGNGSLTGKYTKAGNTVTVNITMTAGSTTTFGTGTWTFALPFNASESHALTALMIDTGTAFYIGAAATSTGVVQIDSHGGSTPVASTVPFTWATGDVVIITGTYRIA
jgi:ribosomal protein S8E